MSEISTGTTGSTQEDSAAASWLSSLAIDFTVRLRRLSWSGQSGVSDRLILAWREAPRVRRCTDFAKALDRFSFLTSDAPQQHYSYVLMPCFEVSIHRGANAKRHGTLEWREMGKACRRGHKRLRGAWFAKGAAERHLGSVFTTTREGNMHTSASILRHYGQQVLAATLIIIAVLLVLSAALLGQAYFGTVSGELTDASGAVVQGARVLLTDQQKGFEFTTTSDSSGRYLFRSIPPGVYTVSADAKGFDKALSARLKLDINENATANLTLKVAGASQTVQVEAQAQAIQTEDAETGQVVNRRFINDLPLIDRNVIALVNLAPGVTEMDDQCDATCTGTNFVSNGSRGSTADILTDGASVTNSEPNGGITSATYVPSPEAIEEFKVQQTNFSAEYGFSGASVVNMVTRSGTNKFHGSGYEFFRDDSLDANNWFANRAGQPIPPLRRNNYGCHHWRSDHQE